MGWGLACEGGVSCEGGVGLSAFVALISGPLCVLLAGT